MCFLFDNRKLYHSKIEALQNCPVIFRVSFSGETKYERIERFFFHKIPSLEHPASEFQKPKYVPKQKVCPECGISVFNLGYHLSTHKGEKQICPHCAREVRSLQVHIKNVHTKLPCSQCGKLVGSGVMNRHMASAHTPNDQKKYQCDICGKGFASKNNFQEHKYVHTGEKPYKCKYCSACFASKGTHAMHEKGHLGHRRNSSKV